MPLERGPRLALARCLSSVACGNGRLTGLAFGGLYPSSSCAGPTAALPARGASEGRWRGR